MTKDALIERSEFLSDIAPAAKSGSGLAVAKGDMPEKYCPRTKKIVTDRAGALLVMAHREPSLR